MKDLTQEELENFPFETANVPCGTCNACCRNTDPVLLDPDENPANYKTTAYLRVGLDIAPRVGLAMKENGNCYYLGETGCTIYDKRPRVCRAFDCRMLYLSLPPEHWAGNPDPKLKEGAKRADSTPEKTRKMAAMLREFRLEKNI